MASRNSAENETSIDASRVGESFVDGSVKVGRRPIDERRGLSRLVLGPAGVLEPAAKFRQQPVLHRLRLTQPTSIIHSTDITTPEVLLWETPGHLE